MSSVESITVHRYGNPDALPVVLVHGLTDAGTAWPDLVQHWGDRWDVHAPDLRGHGLSPRFTDDELAAASAVLLADIVALVDALPEPVALVGHSLGGVLALRAALARPGKVRALVLEDPAKPTGAGADPGFVAGNEQLLDSVAADAAAEVARMLAETPWSRTEVEAWATCKPLVDREYVRRGLHLGGPEWEELFNALTVPTLLLVPPDAPMAPRADALHNPLVRTVVVPDSGHCVRRDQPARYQEEVDAFLARTLASVP
ncbi:alpha/beta fold hydrolase [Cellulomonas fengjieae]|uniref:alpha/beta fold hydrolase n=1 Tax=Cellulomonas fengjieae TaxID=2819978 RepID=UPI001AAEBBFF|nr:alpha/beta hydrolase [Cellulomonas fengjieae]MBO3103915.1 alpha/beta hydrolase [Cellulomonas fengjieae]